MSSTITKVMAIRVKNEVAEYFKDKKLNRLVESMYEGITRGDIEIEEEEIVVKRGRYRIEEFEEVCREAGCSPVLMMEEVIKGIRAEL